MPHDSSSPEPGVDAPIVRKRHCIDIGLASAPDSGQTRGMLIRFMTLATLAAQPRTLPEIFREVAPHGTLLRPLSLAQIRNTVHRLEQEGLVSTTHRAPRGRRLTETGRETLEKWLRMPPARTRPLEPRKSRIHFAAAGKDIDLLNRICDNDIAHLAHRQRLLDTRDRRDFPAAREQTLEEDLGEALRAIAIRSIAIERCWLAEMRRKG